MDSSRRKWINKGLFIAILVAVAAYIYGNIDSLSRMEFELDWSYMALATICVFIGHLGNMMIWSEIAEASGFGQGVLSNGVAWILSRLGRYVPGKIALLLTRFRLYPRASRKKLAMATLVEYLSSLSATCVISIVALLSFPGVSSDLYLLLAFIALVLLAVLLHPSVMQRLANVVLRKLNKRTVDEYPAFGTILKYILAFLFPVLFHGLGFFLLLNALHAVPLEYYIAITGVYYASALIGMAAVFAPSGIGVREGVMFLILPLFMQESIVIVGAVMIRLLTAAAELTLAGVAFFLWNRARPVGGEIAERR